jgi:hypothetical protein
MEDEVFVDITTITPDAIVARNQIVMFNPEFLVVFCY